MFVENTNTSSRWECISEGCAKNAENYFVNSWFLLGVLNVTSLQVSCSLSFESTKGNADNEGITVNFEEKKGNADKEGITVNDEGKKGNADKEEITVNDEEKKGNADKEGITVNEMEKKGNANKKGITGNNEENKWLNEVMEQKMVRIFFDYKFVWNIVVCNYFA